MNANSVVRAFSEEHVVRVTGLSHGQLRAWDRRGFFKPQYAYENRKSPYSRVFSFQDLVGLRAIAVLMKDHGVSLQELRKVANDLESRGFEHWADVKLYVVNKQVHFRPPSSDNVEGVWDGQFAMLPVISVIDDVEKRVEKLRKRKKNQHGKVEHNKYVVRNTNVIAGTRIPTATIKRFYDSGCSVEKIIQEYPTLTRKDVEAALVFENSLEKVA